MPALRDYARYHNKITQLQGKPICYIYALNASLLCQGQRQIAFDTDLMQTYTGWNGLVGAQLIQLYHLPANPGGYAAFAASFAEGDVLVYINDAGGRPGQQAHFVVRTGNVGLFAGVNNPPDVILADTAQAQENVAVFQVTTPAQKPAYFAHHHLARIPAANVAAFINAVDANCRAIGDSGCCVVM